MKKKIMFSHSYDDREASVFISSLESELKVLNIEIIRFDSFFAGDSIFKNIIEVISTCDIFICFIKPSNANVMLELGYAMGIGKNIIIIGEHNEIPFDLQGMRYFTRTMRPYELITHLEKITSEDDGKTNDQKTFDVIQLIENKEILSQISGFDFENIVIKWLRENGYEIIASKINSDIGYDFKMFPLYGETALVEVKKYLNKSKVPIEAVRRLGIAMFSEEINIGLIISSSQFTEAAHAYTSGLPMKILLWTLDDLIKLPNLSSSHSEC